MASAVPSPCCYTRRVGNFYIYSERETDDGSFDVRCMVGPCWPMLGFTYLLIIGISSFVYSFTFPKVHPAICVLAVCSLLGLVVALQRTACTNPGMLPRYSKVCMRRGYCESACVEIVWARRMVTCYGVKCTRGSDFLTYIHTHCNDMAFPPVNQTRFFHTPRARRCMHLPRCV
jgi:hypothetical protein